MDIDNVYPNYKYHTTEKEFSQQVEDLLTLFGWQWCHFRPARTEHGWRTAISGKQGFPDYIAVRGSRILIFELKSYKGKVSDKQQEWLNTLKQCPNLEVFLWRAEEDSIEEILEVLK